MKHINKIHISRGFTLVELMVSVAVLAILAGVSVVGYGKWRESVAQKEVQSDLQVAASAMEGVKNFGNGYPSSIPPAFKGSPNVTVTYISGDDSSYCIRAVSNLYSYVSYYLSSSSKVLQTGGCTGGGGGGTIANGDPMQTVTGSNCPTGRTMVVDARDNHTYWIQKLSDDKCWMLTNLAYAGGGTNTYTDTVSITGLAQMSIPSGANPTTNPTSPSSSTNGTGQYGYLYNYCAATGAHLTWNTCSPLTGSPTPQEGTYRTICPAGWRLPLWTNDQIGEYRSLNIAVNGGSTNSSTGLRTTWLGQYSGNRNGNADENQGLGGWYWYDHGYGGVVYAFGFSSSNVNILFTPPGGAQSVAVRCLAV